ncbi:hypothetical protein RRG08_039457 [Elysia crispata]|nr:hypothetical protein RRG08_039457 [Elysia crispata]
MHEGKRYRSSPGESVHCMHGASSAREINIITIYRYVTDLCQPRDHDGHELVPVYMYLVDVSWMCESHIDP